MACKCMEGKNANRISGLVDTPGMKRPDEPCLFCAEKHLAVAYGLSEESGYESPNRMKLLANLVLAQWHLWRDHRALAGKIRDIRHAVQSWKPLTADLWAGPLAEVQALTHAEAKRLGETDAEGIPEPDASKI